MPTMPGLSRMQADIEIILQFGQETNIFRKRFNISNMLALLFDAVL